MSFIETYPVQHSTILRMYSEKDSIIVDPEYQRNGGVWTPEKKQLLIDSIINNYDIPKIYFHQFNRNEKASSNKAYAIIDGKQRLETIWDFIDGKFCLSNDFDYQDNPLLKLAGLSYDDLSKEHPKIKINFDSFVLPIVGVQTDDLDLIEDMFSRLNEAVPLNSAEKRNAFGGYMVKAIRDISQHELFTKKVRFNNRRFQHYEIAARLILVEISQIENNKLIDTKKVYLDAMAKNYRTENTDRVEDVKMKVSSVLNLMNNVYVEQDILLRAQGSMVVNYLLFKWANEKGISITRSTLLNFDNMVKSNKILAEVDYEAADYDLLEFDRLNLYGTNDVSNIKERYRIISEFVASV